MKRFIYIITDSKRYHLHIGLCSNMSKTMEFYKRMPTIFFDPGYQLEHLMYFEEVEGQEQALERFKYVSTFSRQRKEQLIESINPDWTDLIKTIPHE